MTISYSQTVITRRERNAIVAHGRAILNRKSTFWQRVLAWLAA